MSLNALSIRLQVASRYHADRPCETIIADGSQAGIDAALKNPSCSATLISLVAPDGGTDVAAWKTAPVTGGKRHTNYSGSASAIGSIQAYYYIETPRMLLLGLELAGTVEDYGCHAVGEVLVGLDSAIGESATYGNADGRTLYGQLVGRHELNNATGRLAHWANTGQSFTFVGAESTRRRCAISGIGINNAYDYTTQAAYMVPAGYGAGEWSFRLGLLATFRDSLTFHAGFPAWLTQVKYGAHWSALNLDGVATKRLGHSATLSSFALSPRRKDGAASDTIYATRVASTWVSWPVFLQSLHDDWNTAGHLHYWEILGTA
jgi:hypothetical protein